MRRPPSTFRAKPNIPAPLHDHRQLEDAILSIKASFSALDSSGAKLERAVAHSRTRLFSNILGNLPSRRGELSQKQHAVGQIEPVWLLPKKRRANAELGDYSGDTDASETSSDTDGDERPWDSDYDGGRRGYGKRGEEDEENEELCLATLAKLCDETPKRCEDVSHWTKSKKELGEDGVDVGVRSCTKKTCDLGPLRTPVASASPQSLSAKRLSNQASSQSKGLSRHGTCRFSEVDEEDIATLSGGTVHYRHSLAPAVTRSSHENEAVGATCSVPRVQVRIAAERPFSAPRMRWGRTTTAVHAAPATARPATARSSSDRRGKDAVGLEPTHSRRPCVGKHKALRPHSAFGALQRPPQRNTVRERAPPPLVPVCKPQAEVWLGNHVAK